MHVTVGLHSATISENACLFIWLISLVVSVQWDRKSLLTLADLSDQDGSWVSYVSAEDLCSNDQDRDACWPTEPQVNLWISEQGVLNHIKALVELLFNLSWVDNSLRNLGLIKCRLDALLDILSESSLDKVRHFFAKDTMAVSHCKEMSSPVFTEMWQD